MGSADWLEEVGSKRWFGPIARGPLLAFRLGLAPLVGRAFLALTTTGRVSGLPRHTVLLYGELDHTKYVAAIYGHRSEWYRNIRAHPLVGVVSSQGTESCRARPLEDPAEIVRVVGALRKRLAMRAYLASLGIAHGQPPAEEMAERVRLVALEPSAHPVPSSVRADLVWVWALTAGAAFAVGLLRRARATTSDAP